MSRSFARPRKCVLVNQGLISLRSRGRTVDLNTDGTIFQLSIHDKENNKTKQNKKNYASFSRHKKNLIQFMRHSVCFENHFDSKTTSETAEILLCYEAHDLLLGNIYATCAKHDRITCTFETHNYFLTSIYL